MLLLEEEKAEMIKDLENLMSMDTENTFSLYRKKVGDIEKFIDPIIVTLGYMGKSVCLYPIDTVIKALAEKNEGRDGKRAKALSRMNLACGIEWVEVLERKVK